VLFPARCWAPSTNLQKIVGLGAPAEAPSAEKTAAGVGEFAEIAGAEESTTVSDETAPRTPVVPVPNRIAARDKDVAMLGSVSFGAVLGALARERLGVWCEPFVALSGSTGKGGIVIKDLVANFVGCFVMGAGVEARPWLQPPHPTVYAALTTGFCGCCTTFSSYNSAVAILLLRSGGVALGVSCALMAIAVGAATAWIGLQLGRQLTMPELASTVTRIHDAEKRVEAAFTAGAVSKCEVESALDNLIVVASDLKQTVPEMAETATAKPQFIRPKLCFYWASLLIAACVVFVFVYFDPDIMSKTLATLLFAPLGASVRYQLGLRNKNYRIPLMTMLCNVTASAGSAALTYALDEGCEDTPDSTHWKSILGGISVGFCGSLSTVSTFVDEVRRLGEKDRRLAWAYGCSTLISCQALAVLIIAPLFATADCFR